jgi:hypothetical protein
MITDFPCLREVELRFDEDFQASHEPVAREFYQKIFLGATSGAPFVDSLILWNVEDFLIAAVPGDYPKLSQLKSRLKELVLHIATEKRIHEESDSDYLPVHRCFAGSHLFAYWLEPTQSSLTQLTLGCVSYWGVWPFADVRRVHFPHLRSLVLGNWTIAHDWQIDWITSHGATLEELSFDNCVIIWLLHRWAATGDPSWRTSLPEIVDANWPEMCPPDGWGNVSLHVVQEYPKRWSDIYVRFQESLVNLKYFDTVSKGSSYMAYRRMDGRRPWFKKEDEDNESYDFVHPDCEAKDEAALNLFKKTNPYPSQTTFVTDRLSPKYTPLRGGIECILFTLIMCDNLLQPLV